MSQRDNFANGFLLGAIVGGAVGGIIGAIVTSRSQNNASDLDPSLPTDAEAENMAERRNLSQRRMNEVRMDSARRSLEGKIAQLNDAIDDVRQRFEESSP